MAEAEYISADDAARELGVSRATFWRLMAARGVTRYKLPGERRSFIRRDDLERLGQPVPRGGRELHVQNDEQKGGEDGE